MYSPRCAQWSGRLIQYGIFPPVGVIHYLTMSRNNTPACMWLFKYKSELQWGGDSSTFTYIEKHVFHLVLGADVSPIGAQCTVWPRTSHPGLDELRHVPKQVQCISCAQTWISELEYRSGFSVTPLITITQHMTVNHCVEPVYSSQESLQLQIASRLRDIAKHQGIEDDKNIDYFIFFKVIIYIHSIFVVQWPIGNR